MNEDNAAAAVEAARTAAEAAARSSEAATAATAAAEAATNAAEALRASATAADAAGVAALEADAIAVAASAASGGAIDPTIFRLAIFVLAIFVGYYVVWSVTPALHTPLMSVTNAISSVIVVGALLATGVSLSEADGALWAKAFGFVALILASVNIFGGFLVTQRMLGMYKKKR
ncbi:NAD(P) transhydrogenase subunit alpha [Acuticoccus sp.]|uniref:NAD(P) transhydrogenase subunit alpha n=1 Tax=Acuticoccus sp. TaxID=1904378 RepID=UPI003B51ADBD